MAIPGKTEVPIAIIGGGAAGVWQAAALSMLGALDLTIVEPSEALGRGLAYSTSNPGHLLNVTADKLDAHPLEGFEPFIPWLERHGMMAGETYFPRKVYGDYMDAVVSAIRQRACLSHHVARARSLTPVPGGFRVMLDNGDELLAHQVVLALGNLKPRRLAPIEMPGLAEDPWNIPQAAMAGADEVVIAGTGLTAIDAVLSVANVSPNARFTLAANRPFMPPSDAKNVSWPGVADLTPDRPSRLWRSVIAGIRSNPEGDWITVVEALKTRTAEFWQNWSPGDRATFARHGLRHWLHHRHRTPPPSHKMIAQLIANRRLTLCRGRISSIRKAPSGLALRVGDREMTADLVINATGPSVDPRDEPLLSSALDDGLVTPDPLGLGLKVDLSGQSVTADGSPAKGLYILGAWTRGVFFEVVPIPMLRKHAMNIASEASRHASWRSG
ncbi:MAG: pyridine nucleotide-disulfide oxidoreductase [Rhizobiaceae bacterium MnEN-MB40S]|nr:MAG: pyridine nucleotide-disulfide oxidoreductase [Rhizobiaceae bacterium MnEN-MB40S]